MRRAIAGALTLAASIALPATFQGTIFLIVLWGILGLAGIALIATSEPVKKPLLAALKKELGITPELETKGSTADKEDLRIAVGQLCDELEYAKPILEDHDLDYFGRAKGLPMRWYDAHSATLARYGEMDAHEQVVRAYHSVDAVNRSFEEISGSPEPEIWIDPQRADAAIPEIESAIKALRKINVG